MCVCVCVCVCVRARVCDCGHRRKLEVQAEEKIPLQQFVYPRIFLATQLKRGKLVTEIFSKPLFRWCKKN